MKKGLLVGFESAQGYWRLVGERLAAANAGSETRKPLLIRILFERGEGVDLTPLPRRTRMTTAPEQVDAPAIAELPLTLECRIIYRRDQDTALMPDELRESVYGDAPVYHTAYYGEVVDAYIVK